VIGVLLLVGLITAAAIWWWLHPAMSHEKGIVYGERNGRPLTYDVLAPSDGGNGRGILFLVSGSWKSKPGSVRPWLAAPLVREGFTVFAVCHHSQPEVSVMDIVADIERAVRHIRHGADARGIDPDRLGISGGSSGGHLSLMMATRGGPGDPAAPDPVDRESSEVQAAAVFFPVTDLIDLGDSTENLHDGGPPKSYKKAFGPDTDQAAVWDRVGREVSPIYHVTADLPPVLIYHGDADTLVPLDQSTRFRDAAAAAGHEVELVVREGKSHGWLSMLLDIRTFAKWYEEKLR
jgi:acetyl esterase/lipase